MQLSQLLLGPAERADVIVDFSGVTPGIQIILKNLGPDEPFGGGVPGVDFSVADPDTTGQVMQFRLVAAEGKDHSKPPSQLNLPRFRGPGPTVANARVRACSSRRGS